MEPIKVVLTPDLISGLAGIVLSLIFSYVPGAATWYNKLDGTSKRLFMLMLLVTTVAVVFGLSCAGIVEGVVCTKSGLLNVLPMLGAAIVANQVADRLSPPVGLKRKV